MKEMSGRRAASLLVFAIVSLGGVARLDAQIGVTLEASHPGPETVGTVIRWTAQAFSAPAEAELWYRFRVREPGGEFRMIRDFGPIATLDWTSLDEGVYELEAAVRERTGLEIESAVSAVELVSRVAAEPAVSDTAHPLVFVFSSPGCEFGLARVRFESEGGIVQETPFKPCRPGRSLNFYLAGLAPNRSHLARLIVEEGRNSRIGPVVAFETGDATFDVGLPTVVQASSAPGPEWILLQAPILLPAFATDMNGNLLWSGPRDLSLLIRHEEDGTFFGLRESREDPARDIFRKFDLAGTTVLETNAARVSEQLVAMGKRPITGFHHEVRTIRGGRIVALGTVEQILTNVQGPLPVDVLGDMIVVLDENLQVVWSWDAFDHLDARRRALLGITCPSPGCGAFYLAPTANDWTHANSISETPDGALLLSIRHQDWVIKIDYAGGAGNGDVLWRLGKDGDFTFESDEPYPWFSHQHDAAFEPGSSSRITLFDNGNVRSGVYSRQQSRGQVIEIDEANRTARLALNVDLGVLSLALGSAQKLEGGRYSFDAGFVRDDNALFGGAAFSMEISPAAEVSSTLKLMTPVYRSFRLSSLYGGSASPARPTPRVVGFRD